MTQLSLLAPPPPTPRPAAYLAATHLLWRGAGCPDPEHAEATEERCWWCGEPSPGVGAPLKRTIPGTFTDGDKAALPSSRWVCAPCAWSVCDRVALPDELARAGLEKRIDAGGRLRASVQGDPPGTTRLFLRLADGKVGVWSSASPAAKEGPWMDARERLRESPESVGPCELLAIVEAHEVTAGPTARFRNYHHLGTASKWRPCTNADKAVLREWLLSPPGEEWACVIGDGQKHAAIHATTSAPLPHAQEVYLDVGGDAGPVTYAPDDLAQWLAAYEGLIRAGADDDEIVTGKYLRGGFALGLAVREHDPVLKPIRGGTRMRLVSFLRRSRKDLAAQE